MKMFTKLAVAASLLGAAAPALAVNNGFENGLTGWTASSVNAGTTSSISAGNTTLNAFAGSSLGFVSSAMQDNYRTLSQTFVLAAGGSISGQVAFLTSDYQPFNDDGYLSVNGLKLFTASVGSVGNGGGTGWTAFNFIAQTAGNYTLEIGVANRGDSSMASYTALDGISITGGAVPEPAQWALMLGGFGLAGASMRRRRTATVYA